MKKIVVCFMLIAFLVTSSFVRVNASVIPPPLTPGYGPPAPTDLIGIEKRIEDEEALHTSLVLDEPSIYPVLGVNNDDASAVRRDLTQNLYKAIRLCARNDNGGIPIARGNEIYRNFQIYLLRMKDLVSLYQCLITTNGQGPCDFLVSNVDNTDINSVRQQIDQTRAYGCDLITAYYGYWKQIQLCRRGNQWTVPPLPNNPYNACGYFSLSHR